MATIDAEMIFIAEGRGRQIDAGPALFVRFGFGVFAVIKATNEGIPACPHIAEGLSELGFARELAHRVVKWSLYFDPTYEPRAGSAAGNHVAILRSAPPQPGQVHGAGCRRSSLGRCSGNGRRAGLWASAAVSTAAATAGDAVASRFACSLSSASSASSSGVFRVNLP